MITASDIEVLKDTADNVPVTREILERMGFVFYSNPYSYSQNAEFRKGKIVLTEYRAETNPAIIKPYERCYSCHINIYDRQLNYVIYTVKQLKIFLRSYEEIQQLKMQTDKEIDRIGEQLYLTLLQKNDY